MLKHDEYIKFKARSKKHMLHTLSAFHFWGEKVGRIRGQIKEKFGEVRWYAELRCPDSLIDFFSSRSRWYRLYEDTDKPKYLVLDVLNNMSKISPLLLHVLFLYSLFFYNVAHWVAFVKNPDCADDILSSADHSEMIVLKKFFIKLGYILNINN